jgi:tripartite-type tricarboxylate transporter receptor subunit TctC
VIVENRPGASGVIAVTAVKNAQPDGHFLMFGQFSNAILAPLVRQPRPYETPKDFAPVALIMSYPLALATHASVPVTSLSEFAAYAKANPGKLNVGTVGVGSWGHIAIELFVDRMGIDMVRVPYTGMTPAVQALVAGDIHVLLAENNVLAPHVEAGKVRALAHFGAKDSPRLPNVEPIGALLPELEQDFWFSVLAPAGTSPEVVRFLNREINAVMNEPAVKARAAAAYMRTYDTTPEVLAAMIANEWDRWGTVIREKNLELK